MGVFPYLGVLFLVLGAGSAVAAFGVAPDEVRGAAIILALTFLPMGALFAWFGIPSRRTRAKNRGEKGRRGTARILALEDSGTRVQGMPFVKFQLEVVRDGQPPQIVSTGSVVRKFTKLEPGMNLPVLVDPVDPNKVKIDWDR